jgi:hypothetical protein
MVFVSARVCATGMSDHFRLVFLSSVCTALRHRVLTRVTHIKKKKQLYYNEDGGRGAGEVGVDDDWVQGLYDMEGMSGDTA